MHPRANNINSLGSMFNSELGCWEIPSPGADGKEQRFHLGWTEGQGWGWAGASALDHGMKAEEGKNEVVSGVSSIRSRLQWGRGPAGLGRGSFPCQEHPRCLS